MPVIWIGKVLLRMYLSGKWKLFWMAPMLIGSYNWWHQGLAKTQEQARNQDISQKHFMNLRKLNLFENICRQKLKQNYDSNFIRYNELGLLFINTQHFILSGCSQSPFAQNLFFPHLKRKKKKIILFYWLVAHYNYVAWVKRSGEEIDTSPQNPVLAIVKLFFMF